MTIDLEFRYAGPQGHTVDKFPSAPESPRIGELVILKSTGRYRVIDVIRHYYGVNLLSVTAIVEYQT